MILWTIVPPEIVFRSDSPLAEEREILLNGTTLVVHPDSNDQVTVVRVITTNPSDYLNPLFQPGTVLRVRTEVTASSL